MPAHRTDRRAYNSTDVISHQAAKQGAAGSRALMQSLMLSHFTAHTQAITTPSTST
jgi:hypothetical protein